MTQPKKRKLPRGVVPDTTSTGVAFVDETGSISQGRFFGVGCLKMTEPSVLLRQMQKLRDRRGFYIKRGKEFHFADVTQGTLPIYKEAVDLVLASEAKFSCFVADRQHADPVARFGTPWKAYEKLATQLLLGSIRPREIITVLADNYSTPDHVQFEVDVKHEVNRRLHRRLAVSSVFRLDSKSTDGLQLVDILLGSVAFEYRLNAGEATHGSVKHELSEYVRGAYGVADFQPATQAPPELNIRRYGP
jgi:hypothetical protein